MAGLTPENVSQAFANAVNTEGLMLNRDQFKQQKVNDLINNIYKMGMLEAQQPRPVQTFVTNAPGYGDLTLDQYKALPSKDREYISYVLASRQIGEEPLAQTEWEKISDKDKIPTTAMGAAIASYFNENKKLPPESELKRWSELYRTPPVEVNIGEKAASAAAVKEATGAAESKNKVRSPEFAQSVTEDLMKDKGKWYSVEEADRVAAERNITFEEAQQMVQKVNVLKEMDSRVRAAFKDQEVERKVDGWYVNGKLEVRNPYYGR